MAQNKNPKKVHDRLKKKSPWFESIRDPLHGADVKIPDSTGVETGTLQLVERVSVTVPALADAVCGVRTTCLHPNEQGGIQSNYQVTDSALSTSGAVSWNLANIPFPTNAPLQSYSDGVRVVSAAMYCQSEASLATNSGLMTAYVEGYPDKLILNGNPLTDYQNAYKTAIVPINNNEPAMVRFFPIKQDGGQYDMFYRPTAGIGGVTAGGTFENPFWEMGVLIHGAPVGAVFLFTIVVNYEFVPFENAINILDASPSPVDAQEVDLVELWTQDLDPAQITTNQIVARPPASSEVEEPGEETGFGMFFEVIKELAPLALSFL
jgi:hypothetical protein